MNENIVDILLVEDDPHDAELTLMTLHEHNIINNIMHVKDGAEALDYLFGRGVYAGRDTSFLPKVILMDLKLPKISGLDVLKEIRSHNEFKDVPIVILTSSSMETDIIESYKLGVNSYIVKPVNFENFVESVKQIGYYWMILNKIPNE
jgi:CheY-like chemotaxis protein